MNEWSLKLRNHNSLTQAANIKGSPKKHVQERLATGLKSQACVYTHVRLHFRTIKTIMTVKCTGQRMKQLFQSLFPNADQPDK